MLKKIVTFYRSGGLSEVLKYGFTYLKKIFYYRSDTIYFYLHLSEYKNNYINTNNTYDFKVLRNIQDIDNLDFQRIKMLPYKKWINNGSFAIVGFYNNKPISFTWLHNKIPPDKNIILMENQCWVGPSFVDRKMRGKRVNTAQKVVQLTQAKECASTLITAINIKNTPSLKTNIRAGFTEGLSVVKYYGFFSDKTLHLEYYNQGKEIIIWNER